ncbi:MAG: hypothetical protein QOG23_1177 [Blastocatellia bacterium]|jgi:hypothetical protein|nr:hypothetical protein [Blastocatellia bacterium]
MFCPQCGSESSAELHYCRTCGANLKVIGKAVSLSEAIARSDGVPAKIKEMVKNLKVEKVTDEVSRALDRMNKEIVHSANDPTPRKPSWIEVKKKTAAQRRERHLTKGTIKFFWGGGLTIFLFFLANALVLKLPPDVIAKVPFEIGPVVHVIWLLGLNTHAFWHRSHSRRVFDSTRARQTVGAFGTETAENRFTCRCDPEYSRDVTGNVPRGPSECHRTND